MSEYLARACPSCGATRDHLSPGETKEFDRFAANSLRAPVYVTVRDGDRYRTIKGKLWEVGPRRVRLGPMTDAGEDRWVLREAIVDFEPADHNTTFGGDKFPKTHDAVTLDKWGLS